MRLFPNGIAGYPKRPINFPNGGGPTVDDTGQAQEKAKEVAGQAKGRLREQVDQRSTQAGQQLSSAADDVRSVAEQFRTQGKDTPARYAEQTAEKAQKVGQRLRDASGDELLRDVEDFARKNPWAVVAGGLVLGLAASRMLKASSSERYRSSIQNGSSSNGQTRSLAAEPMPSGSSTSGGQFAAGEHTVGERGSMVSTEPRT
jgi:ElaB/YqjD/DUF883 family membrane-anchored ribosome-binding protein